MRERRLLLVATGLLLMSGSGPLGAQESTTPAEDLATELVDTFNKLSGRHPGYRANHAKGIVAKGTFTSGPEAAAYSKAVVFSGRPIPVTVRFSDATGLPTIPDGAKAANPHGLAIKFHLPDGGEADVVLNSLKFFPVSTGTEFLDLLRATAESPPGAPKPTKLDEFLASHPNVSRAFATVMTPASFAEEEYRGINAFVLVNKAGARQAVRFLATPERIVHLDPVEAEKKAADFLIDDLVARLTAGPIIFHLQAQLAKPADSTKDPARPWPESNKVVDLGVLAIDTPVPDSSAAEKELLFLPGQLTEGIEPSDDPMIAVRDATYAVSFGRRAQ